MNILEEIISRKRLEIGNCRHDTLVGELQDEALRTPEPKPFAESLRKAPMGLIAEVKHKSPSAGVIRDPFVPAEIAKAYASAGAHAISVLMDREFFGGGEAHFQEVRAAVDLPMLYKEFVVDPWQIWHARLIGASAVLLIAAALPETLLSGLIQEAKLAGLEVLFEVHDAEELEAAKRLEVELIGINNRNLKTFKTRLEQTLDLLPEVPEGVTLISESGIKSADDVRRLQDAGMHGVLVGEHLLRQKDLAAAVRNLMAT
ncbi:MAG: indole-3-glycerol phosphate synthase TrpC [Verrucomicrobia bacterium]|nr:indole-3-glycerol phosphate synthase TrpC [Verrucomicrobiota bacterium]MCH8512103.1 indole-3-glycerol phosphate synthase TrpC [Kiritimatiellia bacterium]